MDTVPRIGRSKDRSLEKILIKKRYTPSRNGQSRTRKENRNRKILILIRKEKVKVLIGSHCPKKKRVRKAI
jgi:hypothetical protein